MASILSQKQKKREKYTLSDLKTLGNQLLSSRAHVNNLPLLLTFVSPSSPPQHVLEAVLSLQSFFTIDLSSKSSINSDTDAESIYRTWLRSKFDDFVKALIDILTSSKCEETLREVVLDTIMELVKLGNGGRLNSSVYNRFLNSIVISTSSATFLLDQLESKYFNYIDVRYFTYASLVKITKTLEAKDISDNGTVSADEDSKSHSKASIELSIQKIHHILAHIPPLEVLQEKSDYEMWIGSGFSSKGSAQKDNSEVPDAEDKQSTAEEFNTNVSPVKMAKKMKLKFTKAWISFLRLPLPLDVYKEVLVNLHQAVIPHISNPIMLCDFLTRSYDIGGVISVMALSSLYVLMTQHGLEYPNFYEKLYALLVPSIFMAKHRAKFLQLLDSCMKSPLLPAYLAAAFAKKLSRLALSVPPSGALVIIALIHNLLRRHPSINCLVHRENDDGTARDDSRASEPGDEGVDSGNNADLSGRKLGIDHFNNEECDPAKSNAMKSSLWEVDTLRHHYCPPVSRFVLSLETDLTVRAKTTEIPVNDFSSGSYATIFREEMRRRVKQVPVAFYKATPTSLFSESEFVGWTFKCKGSEGEETGTIISEDDHNSAKRQRIES